MRRVSVVLGVLVAVAIAAAGLAVALYAGASGERSEEQARLDRSTASLSTASTELDRLTAENSGLAEEISRLDDEASAMRPCADTVKALITAASGTDDQLSDAIDALHRDCR